MPTYPFICDNCTYSEDVLCKIADKENHRICPKCGEKWREIICAPKMTVIHDQQGIAGLYHKTVNVGGKKLVNTTQDPSGRYYLKNNPDQDPRIIQQKMESNKKS